MKVLGLDLGTGSLGWALCEWETGQIDMLSSAPSQVIACGVRIFKDGFKPTKSGEESLNARRRSKRQARRQLARRAQRRKKLFNFLRFLNLLPDFSVAESKGTIANSPEYFAKLDEQMVLQLKNMCSINPDLWKYVEEKVNSQIVNENNRNSIEHKALLHKFSQRIPYLLRALAAEVELPPEMLGRALFHLGVRRGYKSNRKADVINENLGAALEESSENPKKLRKGKKREENDEEDLASATEGKASKTDLTTQRTSLEQTLANEGVTLGQFFARVPEAEQRIRGAATTRKMYLAEFDKIFQTQKNSQKCPLTEADWKNLKKCIFHQRPLKNQRHLRGKCALLSKQERCARSRLVAQEFRVRATLLNLRFRVGFTPLPDLTRTQLDMLFDAIWNRGENLTEKGAIRLLELPNAKNVKWSLEIGDEGSKALIPKSLHSVLNSIEKTMGKGQGTEFLSKLNEQQKEDLFDNLLMFEENEACTTYLKNSFGNEKGKIVKLLSDEACCAISNCYVETTGFANYSAKAMRKLLVHLRQWKRIDSAGEHNEVCLRDQEFPPPKLEIVDFLRPVNDSLGEIRNPVVVRSLTQLRHVVNAVIKKWGKPDLIRVELAREVKKTSEERMKISRDNKQREKVWDDLSAELQELLPQSFPNKPKGSDLERYLLHIECGGICPYSGKCISLAQLYTNEIQVEHIFPYSRSFDDSFANKTLSYSESNVIKGNKTPFEAFGTTESWQGILANISRWPDSKTKPALKPWSWSKNDKLRRFCFDKELKVEGFLARQLTDTQYSAKLATKFLRTLYEDTQCVQTTQGKMTSELRRITGLKGLLGESETGKKMRDDHRHHTVDALMICMSNQKFIYHMSQVAEKKKQSGERFFKELHEQMKPSREMFIDAIASAKISFGDRVRVRGQFFDETIYGIREIDGEKVAVSRKALPVKKSELAALAEDVWDPELKMRLQSPIGFESSKDSASLLGANGKKVKKLRLKQSKNPENLCKVKVSDVQGTVGNGENHHAEIWQNTKGKWEMRVMSLIDAAERVAAKKSIYKTLGKPALGEEWIMNLHNGDLLQLKGEKEGVWRVTSILEKGQVFLKRVFDARPFGTALKTKDTFTPTAAGLQNHNATKPKIDCLGYVLE